MMMRWTFPICLCLPGLACAGAPQRLDPGDEPSFTAVAADMARELTEDPVTVKSPLLLEIASPKGTFELSLKGAWQWCVDNADDCDKGTARYLRQAFDRQAIQD